MKKSIFDYKRAIKFNKYKLLKNLPRNPYSSQARYECRHLLTVNDPPPAQTPDRPPEGVRKQVSLNSPKLCSTIIYTVKINRNSPPPRNSPPCLRENMSFSDFVVGNSPPSLLRYFPAIVWFWKFQYKLARVPPLILWKFYIR